MWLENAHRGMSRIWSCLSVRLYQQQQSHFLTSLHNEKPWKDASDSSYDSSRAHDPRSVVSSNRRSTHEHWRQKISEHIGRKWRISLGIHLNDGRYPLYYRMLITHSSWFTVVFPAPTPPHCHSRAVATATCCASSCGSRSGWCRSFRNMIGCAHCRRVPHERYFTDKFLTARILRLKTPL